MTGENHLFVHKLRNFDSVCLLLAEVHEFSLGPVVKQTVVQNILFLLLLCSLRNFQREFHCLVMRNFLAAAAHYALVFFGVELNDVAFEHHVFEIFAEQVAILEVEVT